MFVYISFLYCNVGFIDTFREICGGICMSINFAEIYSNTYEHYKDAKKY